MSEPRYGQAGAGSALCGCATTVHPTHALRALVLKSPIAVIETNSDISPPSQLRSGVLIRKQALWGPPERAKRPQLESSALRWQRCRSQRHNVLLGIGRLLSVSRHDDTGQCSSLRVVEAVPAPLLTPGRISGGDGPLKGA